MTLECLGRINYELPPLYVPEGSPAFSCFKQLKVSSTSWASKYSSKIWKSFLRIFSGDSSSGLGAFVGFFSIALRAAELGEVPGAPDRGKVLSRPADGDSALAGRFIGWPLPNPTGPDGAADGAIPRPPFLPLPRTILAEQD